MGGRERPLLPSLTELVLVNFSLNALSLLPLRDVFMKRMEQGVQVEMLDLRMCVPHLDSDCRTEDWLLSLSEIVVDVLGPEKTFEARDQMKSMWKTVARGPFIDYDNSSEDDHSLAYTGGDDEGEDGEE